MANTRSYGRTARGGGAVQASQQKSGKQAPPSVVPLAQTLPSVAPAPKFRPPQITEPQPYQAPNQSPQWREGDNTNDALIHRSRHGYFQQGAALSGTTWNPGSANTLNAGSVRPTFRLLNMTWNWQVGTGSAYTDDLTRPYTHVGEQGSGWTTVNGGAPGFYRLGPGGTPIGDPNQGPGRVWAGPPHGLHTQYPPDRKQTLTNFRARPQMVAPRVDRLSNSRIAGQTYSQWTRHQGGGQ